MILSPMTQKITIEDLVAYIYKEVSIERKAEIREALTKNPMLSDAYYKLKEGFDHLPKVKFNPPTSIVNNILKYSSESTVELQC